MYIVDSSNTGVDAALVPTPNQVVFDQRGVCNLDSTTHMENCSLQQAQRQLDFSPYDCVVKLTTKYKISNILQMCGVPDYDLAVQHNHNGSEFQNTEMFGVRGTHLSRLVQHLDEGEGIQEKRMVHVIKNSIFKF